MAGSLRRSGIDIIGDVNWGTHFCLFYRDKYDLLEMLVPYFKAGLESNEFCMWVAFEPLNADDARQALAAAMPDLPKYVKQKQIEIIPYSEWYTRGGVFDSKRVLNGWVAKLTAALSRGFDGLRLTGNSFWLEKSDWQAFTDYEAEVNSVIGKYRMMAICTYSMEKCTATEVVDVVRNHQFALIKQAHQWAFIEASDYRKMREALKESEERFRQLFQSMTEGFALHEIILDDEGKPCDYRFLEVNEAFGKLTGLSPDKVNGKTVREVIPAIESHWIDMYGKVAITGEAVLFESYSAPLGRWYDVIAYSPKKGQFVTIFRDVSDHRQAVQALANEKNILETIMENTGAMLVYLDPQFNFVRANSAYVKACGHTLKELLGRHHFDLFPNAENQAIFERVRDTGLPVTFHDKPFTYADQPERGVTYWDWTLVPVKDAEGKVQGLVFSLVETTERVRAEQHLATRERLATIGELAGGISHEIRNPLATIDSSAFFLTKALSRVDGRVKTHLDRIHSSVQRATGIIQSLMNLTRMETPRLAGLDLRVAVSEAITNARVPAGVKVVRSFPEDKVVVGADREQLQIAFRNLITNAVQAMSDRGTLTVSIAADHNEAELAFADTGSGIAPEHRSNLFMPLFTTKAQGIGFGLPITKMIVERHGGKIWAKSEPGKGATFIIRLPLHSEETKEATVR